MESKVSPNEKPSADAGSRSRMNRQDKVEATRQKLMHAAGRIIGTEGYSNATVSKITASADLSQGSFYNYFSSQQDLFDKILPELGMEMLEYVAEHVKGSAGLDRERRGFTAFFDYLRQRPEFYRILREAENFSPTAYRVHMENMADGYLRALTQGRRTGDVGAFTERELEVVVYVLLAARYYLSYKYTYKDGNAGRIPDWVVTAYLKFVEFGLRGGNDASEQMDTASGADGSSTHDLRTPGGPVGALVLEQSADGVVMEMTTTDQHLDESGFVQRGALVGFAEVAVNRLIASVDADRKPRICGINSTFLSATAADRVTVQADLEGTSDTIGSATVRIRETREPATVVSVCQMLFSETQ